MIIDNLKGLGTVGHPGIFMGQSMDGMDLRNHLDIPYVMSLAPQQGLDFGVLDLWALKQRTTAPILGLAIENAKTIRTDEEFYNFSLPSSQDNVTRLISGGLEGRDKFGMDGEPIPFVISKRDLSPGSIFKFDAMSNISFTVIQRTIEEVGKHFRLWATLNTDAYVKSVTKAEFQAGRPIVKLADTIGLDFASYKSVWSISGAGMARYKNFLSNVRLQQSYRVTTGAVEYLNTNTRFDAAKAKAFERAVIQFYTVNNFGNKPAVMDMRDQQVYKQWFERLQQEKRNGKAEAMMVNLLDDIAINLLLKQNNEVMMWSNGINQIRDGYDTMRLIPGVWFQLDRAGYKHSFSIETFSLDTLKNMIRDFEEGKVEPRPNISDNVYVVRTGRGGQNLIYEAFMKAGLTVPAQVNNDTHGFLTGDANNLTLRTAQITMFQVPGLGFLKVEYEPGFDPVTADEYTNPRLAGGHRLTSYTMLIEDYDTSGDNVVILRKNDQNIHMEIENGTQSHPLTKGNTNINGQGVTFHQRNHEKTGYEVRFTGKADSAIVIDPTRLLKAVPKNPRTGLSIF